MDVNFQVNHYDVPDRKANDFWAIGDLLDPLMTSNAPFLIANSSFQPGVVHTESFEPPPPPVIVPVQLKPEVALRRVVMLAHGHEITAHQVIDLMAHIRGGVHSFKPKLEWEKALNEITDLFRTGAPAPVPGSSAHRMITETSHTLLAIGRVTYQGLLPLHEAILAENGGNVPL